MHRRRAWRTYSSDRGQGQALQSRPRRGGQHAPKGTPGSRREAEVGQLDMGACQLEDSSGQRVTVDAERAAAGVPADRRRAQRALDDVPGLVEEDEPGGHPCDQGRALS